MVQSDQHQELLRSQHPDPIEPFSLAVAILAATVAAAGQLSQFKERRVAREERKEAREGSIRQQLLTASNRLNELGFAYRTLAAMYQEHQVLDVPTIGTKLMEGDEYLEREVDRLRDIIFESGNNLEKALGELSTLVRREAQNMARKYSANLSKLFGQARAAGSLRQFMQPIGEMLKELSNFISALGVMYEHQLAYGLTEALDATMGALQESN